MPFPKRKHPRLNCYNYSQSGFYYVTIHNAPDGEKLSSVIGNRENNTASVILTKYGKIVDEQIHRLPKRFSCVRVDKYVIMPTHIHMIIELTNDSAGASPRPTLMDVVGAFKSLTTRVCNQFFQTPNKKQFQTSFYESVLRNDTDYKERWRYIDENPLKWYLSPEDL